MWWQVQGQRSRVLRAVRKAPIEARAATQQKTTERQACLCNTINIRTSKQ